MKENWKQGLLTGFITGLVPLVAYVCWDFTASLPARAACSTSSANAHAVIALVWMMSLIFTYPMMVSYRLKYGQLLRNSLLLTLGRLPQTLLFKLISLVPPLIAAAVALFTPYYVWAVVICFLYYILFGFAFSRFVSASFTNAVFDKYINSKIEGAAVDRGLYKDDDEDDEDEDDEDEDTQDQPQR